MANNDWWVLKFEIIDTWIDRETMKAYCVILFPEMQDLNHYSNLRLIESNYLGK
jgi:hypothetical protein